MLYRSGQQLDRVAGGLEQRRPWSNGSGAEVESTLAFPILGFDCDNGSEFLNHHLRRYFARRKEPVQFTRSRPYHKNDNAHVEQKNWTHVRCLLGSIGVIEYEATIAYSPSVCPPFGVI